ncbi:MAG: hypothetical protein ACYDCO_23625 [Armatimonadota bacterium]
MRPARCLALLVIYVVFGIIGGILGSYIGLKLSESAPTATNDFGPIVGYVMVGGFIGTVLGSIAGVLLHVWKHRG